MSQFQYGNPAFAAPEEKPRCWGDERVRDPLSRECRNCPFTHSCGEQITRARNARALAANTMAVPPQQQGYGQAYFAQFASPQMANPLPIMQPQPQQPAPQMRPMTPVPMQAPVQQMQQAPQRPMPTQLPQPPATDRLGWIQDPLYFQIAACPPPPRPQYQGEHFIARMGKNAALDMAESFLKQLLLGVRQLVLPPPPSGSNDGTG